MQFESGIWSWLRKLFKMDCKIILFDRKGIVIKIIFSFNKTTSYYMWFHSILKQLIYSRNGFVNGIIEDDKTAINCMIKIYKRFKKTCYKFWIYKFIWDTIIDNTTHFSNISLGGITGGLMTALSNVPYTNATSIFIDYIYFITLYLDLI